MLNVVSAPYTILAYPFAAQTFNGYKVPNAN